MKRSITTLCVIASLIGGTVGTAVMEHRAPASHRAVVLKPCRTEDQVRPNCYWDAKHRGNGRGTSFVVLNGHIFYDAGSADR